MSVAYDVQVTHGYTLVWRFEQTPLMIVDDEKLKRFVAVSAFMNLCSSVTDFKVQLTYIFLE